VSHPAEILTDRQIADGVATGRLTAEDAATLNTFRCYLRELRQRDDDPQAWRRRWAAYVGGLADGPTTPAEFERIRATRAAERGAP
jgi:hypothetical protein